MVLSVNEIPPLRFETANRELPSLSGVPAYDPSSFLGLNAMKSMPQKREQGLLNMSSST